MDDVGCRAFCARDSGRRMTDTLTRADVERLLADPSPATRADLAAKVAQEFERGGLTPEERRIAEETVRVMARDAAPRARQAPPETARLDLGRLGFSGLGSTPGRADCTARPAGAARERPGVPDARARHHRTGLAAIARGRGFGAGCSSQGSRASHSVDHAPRA